ncbi:hypothetical protein CYLTODRAFT_484218 [Cylindrobasidium torrendii FP15055 ss-10]|uniref:Uncharacterized protein n=1 Tax=Cylindrobasidium torrendii FP15055 ss-10 TaxID=1314674 RepID=A0A0D7AQY5_9AGAR|nr:hypothetical protein CYLTODRAFT_484218 [Cylindrobasidium torrendii FP15055 ss-10]
MLPETNDPATPPWASMGLSSTLPLVEIGHSNALKTKAALLYLPANEGDVFSMLASVCSVQALAYREFLGKPPTCTPRFLLILILVHEAMMSALDDQVFQAANNDVHSLAWALKNLALLVPLAVGRREEIEKALSAIHDKRLPWVSTSNFNAFDLDFSTFPTSIYSIVSHAMYYEFNVRPAITRCLLGKLQGPQSCIPCRSPVR